MSCEHKTKETQNNNNIKKKIEFLMMHLIIKLI